MLEVLVLMLITQHALTPLAYGQASYYTIESSGSVTASGERLDDSTYTCAMPAGEFGDYVLVVADNGNKVVCRLNDRGPFVKGRIIDLSEAAMRRLHPKAGLVKVTVYSLGKELPDWLSPRQLAKR